MEEDEIFEEISFDPYSHEIEWQTYEYEHYEKTPDWYWALGIIALSLVVVAFIFKNFLFAVIVIIGAFTIAIYASRHPEIVDVILSPRGVKIKNRVFPYQNIKSFWIEYDPPHRKELIIESDRLALPKINIHLEDVDPLLVRNFLKQFIREKRHEDSFTDTLFKLLRF